MILRAQEVVVELRFLQRRVPNNFFAPLDMAGHPKKARALHPDIQSRVVFSETSLPEGIDSMARRYGAVVVPRIQHRQRSGGGIQGHGKSRQEMGPLTGIHGALIDQADEVADRLFMRHTVSKKSAIRHSFE
jgi:hypothetical protein